ncbi:MAG: hypothetical protein ACTHQQ_06420 [Solirubrobacteraceae bacterium]
MCRTVVRAVWVGDAEVGGAWVGGVWLVAGVTGVVSGGGVGVVWGLGGADPCGGGLGDGLGWVVVPEGPGPPFSDAAARVGTASSSMQATTPAASPRARFRRRSREVFRLIQEWMWRPQRSVAQTFAPNPLTFKWPVLSPVRFGWLRRLARRGVSDQSTGGDCVDGDDFAEPSAVDLHA